MPTKLLQNLVNQVKDIIEPEFGIIDTAGTVIACSDEGDIGKTCAFIHELLASKEQFGVWQGVSYLKVYIKNSLEYIIYLNSDDSGSCKYLSLISVNIINLKAYYDDKFDKGSLIKRVITGDITPGEIAIRSRELHLPNNAYRAVFIVKTENTGDMNTYEVIQSLFPNRTRDFVILMDDESIVLVKELRSGDDAKEIEKNARIILDTLSTELLIKGLVGIGTVADTLKDIERSYREASIAIEVGGIFDRDKPIANYNSLGIGRLIHQLPLNLCKLFLREVFKGESFDSLDAETIMTIQKFFEHNLNVSETSRELYIHRNTLVYRLNKIQKLTGLDLTSFDDAIIFKVSMLVKRYVDKIEKT